MLRILQNGYNQDTVASTGYETNSNAPYKVSDWDDRVVLRWGNGYEYGKRDFKNVLNPQEAIKLNCRKRDSLQAMAAQGVVIPRMYGKRVPAGALAVVRPNAHGGGEGFEVRKGPFPIPEGCYAIEFIPTRLEVRCWFCGSKTLWAYRISHDAARRADKYPCRSKWPYKFTNAPVPKALHDQALLAARAVGLDCGAADVLVKDGRYYTVEINSAPAVDHPKITAFFKRELMKLAKERYPRVA